MLQADEPEIVWPMPYWHMDIGCAIMVLLLAAVNAGLAAGFAGAHDLDTLRMLLGIPTEVLPVGVIPIGHPAPERHFRRSSAAEHPMPSLLHDERW